MDRRGDIAAAVDEGGCGHRFQRHYRASAQQSVGAYKLEEEGVRLFSSIQGDYFTILGLPLLPLLDYLGARGFIQT